jgi:hypothetical protein
MRVWMVRGVRLPTDHARSSGAQEATVGVRVLHQVQIA